MLHLGQKRRKVDHMLESLQLSRKDHVSISILRSGLHPDMKYWLHKIGRALDTVCWKCGMGEETVEHVMGECHRIQHTRAQLPEPYLITTTPLKPLELLELWEVKPNLPGIKNWVNSPKPSVQLLAQQQSGVVVVVAITYVYINGFLTGADWMHLISTECFANESIYNQRFYDFFNVYVGGCRKGKCHTMLKGREQLHDTDTYYTQRESCHITATYYRERERSHNSHIL